MYRFAAEESMVRYLHIRHFARISLPFTERHAPEDERKVFQKLLNIVLNLNTLCKRFYVNVYFLSYICDTDAPVSLKELDELFSMNESKAI